MSLFVLLVCIFSFLFELCSLFIENWGQGSNLSWARPFFTRGESDAVWTWGLGVDLGYLSMALFILIHRSNLIDVQE